MPGLSVNWMLVQYMRRGEASGISQGTLPSISTPCQFCYFLG
jgi:hypothetical protein